MGRQAGYVALIVIGVILVLGGLVAFGLVQADQVNHAEEGTANTIGAVGVCLGALTMWGGLAARNK